MHYFFAIPEIIHLICKELDIVSRKSLAALAQTCRIFQEPALCVLWYELECISPLILCMPPDLWHANKVRSQKGMVMTLVSFKRPIDQTDWSRTIENARRVRKFTLRHSLLRAPDFHMFNISAGGRILLPNLKQLNWNVVDDSIFPFISIFLGPQIKEIHLSLKGTSFIQVALLNALNLHCPSLACINITHQVDDNIATAAVSAAICGWSQLRDLSVNSLSPDALRHVAQLPLLENLTLKNIGNITLPTLPLFPQDVHCFPSLRTLRVTAETILRCPELMKIIFGPSLASVRFDIRRSSLPYWLSLFNALHDYCNHRSITSIIMNDSDFKAKNHQFCFPQDHMEVFYMFSNLAVLELRLDGDLVITDDAVKKMALAWPQIRTLTLKGQLNTEAPRLTILSLVLFAQYCHKLQHLSLAFDARAAPLPLSEPQAFHSIALTHLDVQVSPISKPLWVAAFLSDIFPKLSTLEYAVHNNNSYEQDWSKVPEFISVLISVRCQERKKIEAENSHSSLCSS